METNVKASAQPPSFREALAYWARLGWVNFGGPAGQIALLHRDLVERRRWIAEERFLHALDVCMLLPGPEAQQLATYIGWHLHGVRGGIAAGALFVLPSVAIILALSWLYMAFGEMPAVVAILDGIKPVVLAIVAVAVVRVGQRALRSPLHAALAVAALVAIALLSVPFPAIVAAAALLGALAARWQPSAARPGPPEHSVAANQAVERSDRSSLIVFAAGLVLWLVPAAVLFAGRARWGFHLDLYLFFTKAAFVTFGGAYAVLAYVAQMATGAGWLTQEAMVDGLALAETTPGPLIIVLQFVGFVAGWNSAAPNGALQSAILAALVTTWATFLPSTLLGLLAGRYIERLERLSWARAALGAVTAAVVGVIASLGLMLGRAILFPEAAGGALDLFSLGTALLALLALLRWKLETHWAIVAGALLGLLRLALGAGWLAP
jgi:chromate transporter